MSIIVIAMAKLPYFMRRSRKKSARSLRTSLLIAFAVAKSMAKNMIIERSRISAIDVILSLEERRFSRKVPFVFLQILNSL
ncbi:hypothetical protein LJR255_003481 [Pararhizobium sp. LjRoot255]|uniref:hypothetical protein n=1 Tax=Pararhizobium sp. LjRoot255 TaxID=3342298 RepID=UPI003ED010A5